MIDNHIHFCDKERYEELNDLCDEARIERAGLVSLPKMDGGSFNDAVLFAIRRSPDRFFGFGTLEYDKIHRLSASKQVEILKSHGFFGLKIWLGKPSIERALGIEMDSKIIIDALQSCETLHMPVLFHLGDPPPFWETGGLYANGYPSFMEYVKRFERLISAFPNLTVICAHLMFLADGIEGLTRIMRAHPLLMLDTAPGRWFFRVLSQHKEQAIAFFGEFSDRVIFGSDAMLFPKEFSLFPYRGNKENLKTIERIRDFLSLDRAIDDPYPWTDGGESMINGLCLPSQTVEEILNKDLYTRIRGNVR